MKKNFSFKVLFLKKQIGFLITKQKLDFVYFKKRPREMVQQLWLMWTVKLHHSLQ